MADFGIAFRITILGNEGGYNPGIGEKETYRGIDRGANPGWAGWKIVDVYKRDNPGTSEAKLNVLLSQNNALQLNIQQFYKEGYWDVVNLDKAIDQQLANNLFDCSVNQGEGMARKFMQLACNQVMTYTHSTLKMLVVDRVIGPATLAAFNSLPPADLMQEINVERLNSYKLDAGWNEWNHVWEKRLLNYV
ncbi:glycosyl hydrolase 108 family protein [Mucilaginibacter sp. L196]|uniref:glycosyl hydrolase 108 family protein n=1 Tax=Mucilaginibacter sp. L196 TaxID=1641870 RepID=UPI00131DD15A|nr:glycosyl hydrolase 108 family protein [Mucilaginibacter sp. L196]